MKKSNVVFTSVLTGGVLMAMLHHGTIYRDIYASRENCQTDWSTHPYHCETSSSGGGSSIYSASSGRHRGPTYESGSRPRTARQDLVVARETVKRSGFGSSGARFSGGG
ncbi:hypothetical protein KRX52_17915 [Pseudomonas sp. MAP12]|uniref:Uncharacterized protein n=1 Tax=Geopseudomonas aromaticivorans TaxID=2849492 RepID=A0ABS6N0S6_9GAMM|nr:hypothetical protein [Pseudomonas aromaticivorans]MBV2134650.1 hypothetical protein [Pseudomonas aromaticivorans]